MTMQREKNLRLTFWGKWKRMITFLIAFDLAMKQLFMCLESLTNITQEFGEVKIHMLLGNFSVAAQRLMCGADFCVTKLLGHFSFSKRPVSYTHLTLPTIYSV